MGRRCSYEDYFEALGQRESGGNYQLESSLGFLGKYQLSEASLGEIGYYNGDGTPQHDYVGAWSGRDGIHSKWDFLNNPAVQESAVREYHRWNWTTLTEYGFAVYVGQTLNGQDLTLSGILGATWLVGFEGMRTFLTSGGTNAPADPYGTSMMEYVALFNGYDTPFGSTLAGDNRIVGGPGDDLLVGRGGDDTLDGGGGRDGARFSEAFAQYDIARAGDAFVVTHARGSRADGTDVLRGIEFARFADGDVAAGELASGPGSGSGGGHGATNGDDRLDGGAGRDRLDGAAGDDTLRGFRAADRLDGGPGRDALHGGAGRDSLAGGPAKDRLFGGSGDDKLDGGRGPDRLAGNDGDDRLLAGRGNDRLFGHAGDDTLSGGPGRDRASGNAGADVLSGDAGADRLSGGAGRDRLIGGAGADSLHGGAGPDRLWGGGGNDHLTGGDGPDTFVFRPGGGRDTITDFDHRADTLDLTGLDLRRSDLAIFSRGDDTTVRAPDLTLRLADFDPAHLRVDDFLL